MRTAEEHAAAVAALLAPLAARPPQRLTVPLPQEGPPRVLAADVVTPIDLPPFRNSQMDGYAVDSRDVVADAELRVSPRITAGSASRAHLRGTATPVMTGAPVPEGADAVIPIERADPDRFPEDGVSAVVRFRSPVDPGSFVRERGSDLAAGGVLLPAGAVLGAAQRGALAAAGIRAVDAVAPIRVGVISTGDELASGTVLRDGEVHDANSVGLAAAVREAGAVVSGTATVVDDADALRAAVQELGTRSDVLITTGGVSQGVREVVRDTLAPLGVGFLSIAMQPGGPQGLGSISVDGRELPVIALPGNPVSVLVSFELLVRPALRSLLGLRPQRPSQSAPLAAPTSSPAEKLQVRRGRLAADGRIELVGGPGSHLLHSYALSSHLVMIPRGAAELHEGDPVEIWRIDE